MNMLKRATITVLVSSLTGTLLVYVPEATERRKWATKNQVLEQIIQLFMTMFTHVDVQNFETQYCQA